MNVTVEDLAPCKKLLRVELEATAVDGALAKVSKQFQRGTQLPGFRPGKAPLHLVLNLYARDIEAEARKSLAQETFDKAVKEKSLRVVGTPDLEEVQFEKGKPYQIAVTIETAPEFELPEYKGLPIKRPIGMVTDADVTRALNVLREQRGMYADVQCPIENGLYAVVNYTGTTDGKPLKDVAPTAIGLTEKKGYWLFVQAEDDKFIPGFTAQLVGAKIGEKRTVSVDFPADFTPSQLAGKKGVFEVEIVQIKERVLPPLDDAFAQGFGAADMAALEKGVRADLQHELNYKIKSGTRDQLVGQLLSATQFELPESLVEQQTRSVVYNLVQDNQRRGVAREVIEAEKDKIYEYAKGSAKDRVRAAFILGRIAEKESIKITQEDLSYRISLMAAQQGVPADRLAKQMRDGGQLSALAEEILDLKVLDFLELQAKVEETLTEPTPAS